MSEQPWYVTLFERDWHDVFAPGGSRSVGDAATYAEQTEREVAFVADVLDLPAGSALLDLCCGWGRHAILLARRGYAVTGLDLSTYHMELARAGADVLGVASIHGIFAPGEVANEPISARVLCLHGHEDPMVPPEQVLAFEEEMTAAGADWQIHVYGGTMHAFTNPAANNPDFGTVYSASAESRAYQSIRNFLAEIF